MSRKPSSVLRLVGLIVASALLSGPSVAAFSQAPLSGSPLRTGTVHSSFGAPMVKPLPPTSSFRSSPCWGTKIDEIPPNKSDENTNISLSSIPSWVNAHKKGIITSAAILTAAALTIPSASFASPTLAEVSTNGEALAASASSFMEKVAETGFYQAFSLVFVSEIGDKTFFIAGLLAMKTSRFVSLVGSVGALAVMTIISVLIGQIFHAVPSGIAQGIPLDDVAAVLAFAFFGFKTLKESFDMEEGESVMDEELAEAEETVEESDTIRQRTAWAQIASTFGLVFAAEFGDRSFLSTIALSAAQNPVSVAGGAIAAHAIATAIAVSGGSYIAKYISEKVIGIIGGSLFLVFAVTTALGIF
uniref:GDT1 family protein n=1 Tax=Helicotheca tamesis TaxID=374047 RepID=A0A7S2HML6_9STRA|mmetsp:Transcript_19469/g.26732  ORF Transcript_19469/g.26732 Transcript_19469/m.26732 type:complete len:359 (+) Transcript_19469:100-1176(+)